ncbi:hypothetical protein Tco_1090101 [Tanacetum coccineum]|uniref:Uncharacterized protein n=1 Tax=Tanacetum coccineum TaxID=301880 RepID=A0ABQ5I5B7_9ASTR
MTYVKSLSADRLKEEFESLQSHLSTLTQQDFTRASKRLGDELEQPFSKRPKPAEVKTTSAAMEDIGAQLLISSADVRTSKESKVMEEKVESSERTPRKRKFVARKGLHMSKSTIPIEIGDPDTEHKMCLKYASDEEDDSDSDTLVPFYAVIDRELLPTGLGTINVIYRKDNSLKYFTSLREILHLVTREDLMTIYGRVVTYYQDKEADRVGLILWGDLRVLIDLPEVDDGISSLVIYMFVDKKYPLTVKLMEGMLDYQLEIGHGAVGNELTTVVQLVKFLKKQIADSKHAGVHDCFWHVRWLYGQEILNKKQLFSGFGCWLTTTQQMVFNSPCLTDNKELASPEQTATGKDISNPFMVVMIYQKSYSFQLTMIHVLKVETGSQSTMDLTLFGCQRTD